MTARRRKSAGRRGERREGRNLSFALFREVRRSIMQAFARAERELERLTREAARREAARARS